MRMTRRSLLGGVLAGLLIPRVARTATDKLLVIYLAKGGWDATYAFDPHFGEEVGADPSSALESAGALSWAGAESRPAVSRFFRQHSSRAAIVNGMAVGAIAHEMCMRIVLTGSRSPGAADLGANLGALTGDGLAAPSLILSGARYPGSYGGAQVPLTRTLTDIVSQPLDSDVQAFLRSEAQRLGMQEHDQALGRLETLAQAGSSLALDEGASWSERASVGLTALAAGLSRCIVIEGTTPLLRQWDSHNSNLLNQDSCFEHAFGQLAELSAGIDSLDLRGRTTVLALSEMGRTPAENHGQGKDHWPYTSLLAWGPTVVAGVHGSSNATLVGQPIDDAVLTPGRLAAGLLEHFDADPALAYPGVTPWRALWS